MTVGLLVAGFTLQAVGILSVLIAAVVTHRAEEPPPLGPVVWGGVAVTSLGSLLLLGSLILAAIDAATP